MARQGGRGGPDGRLPRRLRAADGECVRGRQTRGMPRLPGWLVRQRETLRYALPAYVALILVLAVTLIHYGGLNLHYLNSLLVLSCFLSILSLGQGAVILTGGLDLSLPWTIALSGILLAGATNGLNLPAVSAVPAVLAGGRPARGGQHRRRGAPRP